MQAASQQLLTVSEDGQPFGNILCSARRVILVPDPTVASRRIGSSLLLYHHLYIRSPYYTVIIRYAVVWLYEPPPGEANPSGWPLASYGAWLVTVNEEAWTSRKRARTSNTRRGAMTPRDPPERVSKTRRALRRHKPERV